MSKTFDELKQGAEEIRTNVLPDSNTAGLVGKQLKDMVDKQEEMAGDINNKLNKDVIVQEQGNDPTKVMSQKATIEALNDKLNKDAVSQELGDSKTNVISQKKLTEMFSKVDSSLIEYGIDRKSVV